MVDPLGGSWYLEQLTERLETEAEQLIDAIEAMGGALKALEAGYQQRQISDAAFRAQRAIETRDRIVVGINEFTVENDSAIPTLRVDERIEEEQIGRMREVREGRDREAVAHALAELEAAARGDDNLMPRIIAAVEAYATIGEISAALAGVFGEHRGSAMV